MHWNFRSRIVQKKKWQHKVILTWLAMTSSLNPAFAVVLGASICAAFQKREGMQQSHLFALRKQLIKSERYTALLINLVYFRY